MSDTLSKVRTLAALGKTTVSLHGSRELAADDILLENVYAGLSAAIVVEDSPGFHKGPCVLVLHRDGSNRPLHVVWGIPLGQNEPAVLVTAYRPDPKQWSADFLKRVAP